MAFETSPGSLWTKAEDNTMYSDLKGKTALITGAGKRTGIGYAIACALAKNGTNIVIADLGKTAGEEAQVATGVQAEMAEIAGELQNNFGVESMAVAVDVGSTEAVAEMATVVSDRFSSVEILCNNAGASFGVPNTVHTYDEDAWMKTIDINLHSVFRMSRAVLPLMMGTGGTIINTASRAGKVPPIFNGAYAVAKAGVIMLTKVMARELAGAGIRVNAICPGQIMTDLEKWRFDLEAQFFESTVEEREAEMCKSIPLGRIGKPKEVGDLVAFLASEASSYLTGQAINITGGQLMEC
jgi:NAD(P)-dependent dehydrogenase (short-subunit alcohol dehydrogenase family)